MRTVNLWLFIHVWYVIPRGNSIGNTIGKMHRAVGGIFSKP